MTQQPVAFLEQLLPTVATYRREADRNRQLSSQVLEAVCDSGVLGMPISPAHGGLGTALPDMLQVYEAIAREDAAVSWVIWNAGLVGFYARCMPQALREELFSGCDKLICQSTIPAGELNTQDNEISIRGRWPLMSGSPGAEWAVLSCRRLVNGKPVLDASGAPEIAGIQVACVALAATISKLSIPPCQHIELFLSRTNLWKQDRQIVSRYSHAFQQFSPRRYWEWLGQSSSMPWIEADRQ